ncbi:TIGR02206 family membrane protein [Paenibacillus sp. BK720]|uniref:YwaF family protein n=1 Tax=Paenibacillus sp. BK720 TaxID=2587092 RepID=UPI0014221612|nr:TIGR02206 family membrane protein [Paenibacillus sp. BK720]NIK69929.1 putative integral membrane protein (TIGR02206 family) [Paenibacillus sp. BK720]
MTSFFARYVKEEFIPYSASHIVMLAALVVLALLLYGFRERIRSNAHVKTMIRYSILLGLLAPQILLYYWYAIVGLWSVKYTLPLELCSISQMLAIIMLFTRSKLLYQIVFFAGIGGAMQAMLTPDLDYPYPHFRFFHFFIVHIAIILAPLYMTWIEGFRPTWKSVWLTMIFLNILLVAVGGADYWLDANYMFLREKPQGASLLDLLGPYPYYLIAEEGIALVLFSLMYLPFIPWRRRQS